jgi:hypothetical protein
MLYLKDEDGTDEDTTPRLTLKRLKIGTFKVNFEHHTQLGKRLFAIALRRFAEGDYAYIYVTMFKAPNTVTLQKMLRQYGFSRGGTKGREIFMAKRRPHDSETDPSSLFPFVRTRSGTDYVLAILPKYHAKMFGEVDLRTEIRMPVLDEAPTNSIEKVYLSAAHNAPRLQKGDHIVTYRMTDNLGPAQYRSLVSAVCTLTEVRNISTFGTEQEFLDHLKGRSVFTDEELHRFWITKRYPWILSFLFNFPLKTYPTRGKLLEEKLIPSGQLVCEPLSKTAFRRIIELGGVADEGYVID